MGCGPSTAASAASVALDNASGSPNNKSNNGASYGQGATTQPLDVLAVLSPNEERATYHGFSKFKNISFDVQVPSSVADAAIMVVSVIAKLIIASTCRSQFVKALESRVNVIDIALTELKKQYPLNAAVVPALQNLLDLLSDYHDFVVYIINKPASLFEQVVQFFRAKSDLDNLADYDSLITKALGDLSLPLSTQQLELHRRELEILQSITQQVDQIRQMMEEKKILRLSKKVLTNEEAFSFWCDCFPDRFQVPCDEFSVSMGAWLREFKCMSLTNEQLKHLVDAINIGTIDGNIDAYELNLFFFSLPLRYTVNDFDFVVLAAAAKSRETRGQEDDRSAGSGGASSTATGADGKPQGTTEDSAEAPTPAANANSSSAADAAAGAAEKNEDRETFIEALKQCGFSNAWLWFKIGILTKARIPVQIDENRVCTRRDCFREAVTLDPTCKAAWNNLGALLGPLETIVVRRGDLEQTFGKRDCYAQALSVDPNYARVWYNVAYSLESAGSSSNKNDKGSAGATTFRLGDATFSKRDCYLEALRSDHHHASSWNCVGMTMDASETIAVKVRIEDKTKSISTPRNDEEKAIDKPSNDTGSTYETRSYTKLQCYLEAIRCDPSNAAYWNNAASQLKKPTDSVTLLSGGSAVFTKRDLYVEALRCQVTQATAFRNLCSTLGSGEKFALAFRVADSQCERIKL